MNIRAYVQDRPYIPSTTSLCEAIKINIPVSCASGRIDLNICDTHVTLGPLLCVVIHLTFTFFTRVLVCSSEAERRPALIYMLYITITKIGIPGTHHS